MTHYDYLIVGSGLFGATFAYRAKQEGKKCLVIDKRPQSGGNVYCEKIEGINVHKYGAHIFHTSNKIGWDFVNSIVEFNRYTNCPVANYKGKLYNLPFNMNTFYQMWGVMTPEEAKAKIEEQKKEAIEVLGGKEPQNLEEQALTLVGKDNNYFNDKDLGFPVGGYNKLIEGLLDGIECRTSIDFFNSEYKDWRKYADKLVYTGAIDEYFGYSLGKLDWRTVYFKTRIEDSPNYQGNAVVNYTSHNEPFTRIIEHKHFEIFGQEVYDYPKTVISEEYSTEYKDGMEPYYPVNDERNNDLAEQYRKLAEKEENVIFGGRLGQYKYYDMSPIVELVLKLKNI